MTLEETITERLRIVLGKLPSAAMKGATPEAVMALNDTFGQIAEASCTDEYGGHRNGRLRLEDDYVLDFCWDRVNNLLLAELTICPIHHIEQYEV